MTPPKDYADFGIDMSQARGARENVRVICPDCSKDRKKSNKKDLVVQTIDGVWLCHHCGWTGGLGGGSEKKNVIPLPKPTRPKAYKKPQYAEPSIPQHVLDWFAGRGISEKTLAAEHVGYGEKYLVELKQKTTCIQFPYMREGELVNVKYIKYVNGDKICQQEGGAERILYRIDQIDPECLCITEGEIDALSLVEAGINSVVSVPDGAPTPNTKSYESKFSFLESAEAVMKNVKRIILAGDNDAPGLRLIEELARRLGPERCYSVEWPTGCKDANDVLAQHGKDTLLECIEYAKPWPINGLANFEDFEIPLWNLFRHGVKRGASTGWKSLDRLYTIRTGEVTTVGGIPGAYKSTWVSHLCVTMAKQHDWRFAVFSPEHPVVHMERTIAEQWVGKPFPDHDKGPRAGDMNEQELAACTHIAKKHFTWILGEDEDPTVDYILQLAKVQVYRRGIKGLIIDPWNEVDTEGDKKRNEFTTDMISREYRKIRRFAMNHNVHVWIIAHPTKIKKDTQGTYAGKCPPPTAYDFSGSANFRNKSTNIITLWRDSDIDSNLVEVHVQKVKFPETGRPGMVELVFNSDSARFHDIDNYHVPTDVNFIA